MNTTPLTASQVKALRPDDEVYVTLAGKKRPALAVVTDVPRVVADKWVLVMFSYGFVDRGEVVLHAKSYTATVRLDDAFPIDLIYGKGD